MYFLQYDIHSALLLLLVPGGIYRSLLNSYGNVLDKRDGEMDSEYIRYQLLSGDKAGEAANNAHGDGAAPNQDHMYYGPMLNVVR